MYSIVLMMAATAAPDTANCGWLCGCHGGYASCSGCWGSCYGGCYGGCHGWQSSWGHGCYSSCHGCWGSCYGGCYGSCTGYGIYGGTCLGTWIPGSCYGYGMPYAVPQEQYDPNKVPNPMQEAIPAPKKKDGKEKTSLEPTPTRAAVTVKLPADARLYAEGQRTSLMTNERNFLTPEIQPQRPYRYTLTVEYDRDGKTLTETREVVVKAGERTMVEFKDQAVVNRQQRDDARLTASK